MGMQIGAATMEKSEEVSKQLKAEPTIPRLGTAQGDRDLGKRHAPQGSQQHCSQQPRHGATAPPAVTGQRRCDPLTLEFYSAIKQGRIMPSYLPGWTYGWSLPAEISLIKTNII